MTIVSVLMALLCLLFANVTVSDPLSIKVASHGQTIISASAKGLTVQVKIDTHEQQIGKSSDPPPRVVDSNCTYSRYPCSIVDQLEIIVNGATIFVPRSSFCDLADLNNAVITFNNGGSVQLRLEAGDGAEGTIVTIAFDSNQVRRRTVASGESAKRLLQDTRYYAVTSD